ncbi:MAG: AsmA-like C-terminal region-containing protein [Cytophagales bacterium]|nr:AsmA-like C-terminal region-containing protein [Cytophagales bacterium]
MKILKKALLYFFSAILVVLISATVSLFLFKDRIINEFIREANKNIGTPIKIGKIEVRVFEEFPLLAIVCTDVYIEDSQPGEYPLLTAKSISFLLNPLEVWRGEYTIRGLAIRDSETNLRINKAGKNNFTIVKPGKGGGSVSFDLKNVSLHNTLVTYIDRSVGQHHEFSSDRLAARITARGDLYHIEAAGDITTNQIGVGRSIFFSKKTFDVQAALDYDDIGKSIQFQPSTLSLNGARYEVNGSYQFKEKNLIDLHTVGKNTDIQSLLALLPEATSLPFRQYQSDGDVYFDARLVGEVGRNQSPRLTMSFGMKNVTLFHPGFKSRIERANFEGSFSTETLSGFKGAVLSLKNISASLNGGPFSGHFHLKNFDDPFVTAEFHGDIKASDLLNFYPLKDIEGLTGSLKADVMLSGQVALLKNKSTVQKVRTEGTVELKNLSFMLGPKKLAFSDLNGSLQFNNNDLAMSNLRGRFEKSDFVLNGFFKNIVTYAIFDNQPIGIEADLKSDFLDVDRLFQIGFSDTDKGPYRFSISPALNLNFRCQIAALNFKKFRARNVQGDLLVQRQVAVSRSIKLHAMGGKLDLSGIVDAKNPKAIDLITSATLDGIHIDSVFYVFENFKQQFIQHKHLKGQANAFVNLETTLNEALRIFPETLIADIGMTIRNGELNDFEPLYKLDKYLDDSGLRRLRFADLKNDIHIEKKTIFIPQMEIRSNVTVLQLSGTHTFDQRIDYRVIAPLRNKKKIDSDEAFGAIEENLIGRSKLFLKITGTTDAYTVAYDQVAVRKKIAGDIKREVLELKEAFRLKGKKKKKELELEKGDYFDWEEHPRP